MDRRCDVRSGVVQRWKSSPNLHDILSPSCGDKPEIRRRSLGHPRFSKDSMAGSISKIGGGSYVLVLDGVCEPDRRRQGWTAPWNQENALGFELGSSGNRARRPKALSGLPDRSDQGPVSVLRKSASVAPPQHRGGGRFQNVKKAEAGRL